MLKYHLQASLLTSKSVNLAMAYLYVDHNIFDPS